MPYFWWPIIFLFGAALGSFVSVVANRYNTGLPFFRGRSICFSCNTQLKNKDLIPIFSFLFLKGRCRYCGDKIPRATIFIELLSGVLVVLAVLKGSHSLGLQLDTIAMILTALIFLTILLISIYDLKHFIIPDSFLIIFFIFSFFYILILNISIFSSFLSAILLALPFLFLFLVSKGRWLGLGDVKYIAALGFFLGLVQGLSAVVLSFWIGAAYALFALFVFRKNLTMKSEIPFGPFLSLGIIISFYLHADLFHLQTLFDFF